MSDPRRAVPAIGRVVNRPLVVEAIAEHGREPVLASLRAVLDEARGRAAAGGTIDDEDLLVARAVAAVADRATPQLTEVINATGVLLHTNLGRAPLSPAAVAALTAAAGTVDLELDLRTGERGGRDAPVRDPLVRLTGAEAAFAVNNGAAALVLALTALAGDGGVAVSRGELVEIGGSFRIPDIVRSAGTTLIEVGTTNRTHVRDYREAVEAGASAILRVHPSNFRMDGFVHRPTTAELVEVAAAAGVPFIDDLGSGLLRAHPAAPDEPAALEAIVAGASVVVFSGDKLLGGPQAGIIAGRQELVDRCRRAPLARALRLDKLRLAALAATLASYERDAADELPVWRMAETDVAALRGRAAAIADACAGTDIEVAALEAVLGGGSTPGATLPSAGLVLAGPADRLARLLRTGSPAVVPRIVEGRVVLDLRAVPPEADGQLATAIRTATAMAQARA
ncbi:MAG: L-seryl-tRNA(Sec) selenium transferase [Nitriliruptoraceae bacterium]